MDREFILIERQGGWQALFQVSFWKNYLISS